MKPKFKIEDVVKLHPNKDYDIIEINMEIEGLTFENKYTVEEILDPLEDRVDVIWCKEYYYFLDSSIYVPESYLRRILYVQI